MSEAKDEEDAVTCNPSVLLCEEVELIKGDAIGSTLYSERFVFSTLLKLTKLESTALPEELEQDLCTLWDMTVEADVVKLLLQHSVLEVFANIVENSTDNRLIEILIGTLANMCSVKDTRDALCANPEITYPIMQAIGCFDPLTLIQLMRFFQSVLVFENSGDECDWVHHFDQVPEFVDKFAFIMANSCNLDLLVGAFEAINAICTKFSVLDIQPENHTEAKTFKSLFLQPSLVSSLSDAFKQLMFPGAAPEGEEEAEKLVVTKTRNRIINLFLDIHVILTGFNAQSRDVYVDCTPELLDNIASILQPFCFPINLLPLTTNEQGILDNINEIFQALLDPFHAACFANIVQIYSLIKDSNSRDEDNNSDWGDSKDDEVNSADVSVTLLEFIMRTSGASQQTEFNDAVKVIPKAAVLSVYKAMVSSNRDDEAEKLCYQRIKHALEAVWPDDEPHENGEASSVEPSQTNDASNS